MEIQIATVTENTTVPTTASHKLVWTLDRMIEQEKKVIERWADDLAKNPANAFEWGEGATKAAAKLEVYVWVRDFLVSEWPEGTQEYQIIAAIREEVTDRTMQMARAGLNSSSKMANTMHSLKLEALAGLISGFKPLLGE